jgi:hypothetical protein
MTTPKPETNPKNTRKKREKTPYPIRRGLPLANPPPPKPNS